MYLWAHNIQLPCTNSTMFGQWRVSFSYCCTKNLHTTIHTSFYEHRHRFPNKVHQWGDHCFWLKTTFTMKTTHVGFRQMLKSNFWNCIFVASRIFSPIEEQTHNIIVQQRRIHYYINVATLAQILMLINFQSVCQNCWFGKLRLITIFCSNGSSS